jgi:hypothetical protein
MATGSSVSSSHCFGDRQSDGIEGKEIDEGRLVQPQAGGPLHFRHT